MTTTAMSIVRVARTEESLNATQADPSNYMLLGLGLAPWMEFYTYDGGHRSISSAASSATP
jgi:hypothetical protein